MKHSATILVVDDQDTSREVLARFLASLGYHTLEAASAEAALALLPKQPVDLVITDLRMPGMDGLEGLGRIKAIDPEQVVIMVTAFASIDTAVAAMKAGAFDYVKKPFEFDELELIVSRALQHRRLVRENRELRAQVAGRFRLENIIGKSPAMERLFELVRKVAPADVPVLLSGESGTGKDLVARAIHALSRRADKTFLSLNCAAVPEGLLESELFGHVKGAFSGADHDRPGYFREADGGTLFLDEIGDMTLAHQAKLLRVLESGELIPVGKEQPLQVDVRVIAATHRDLEDWVKRGKFREDLLYRIETVRLPIPPLRERREDIPLLVEHFVRSIAARAHLQEKRLSQKAMQALLDYAWPGNVRELENAIERAALVAPADEIRVEDLPPRVIGGLRADGQATSAAGAAAGADATLAYRDAKKSFEQAYFVALLDRAGGKVSEAAKAAGLHRGTLHEKLKQLGLSSKDDDTDR